MIAFVQHLLHLAAALSMAMSANPTAIDYQPAGTAYGYPVPEAVNWTSPACPDMDDAPCYVIVDTLEVGP